MSKKIAHVFVDGVESKECTCCHKVRPLTDYSFSTKAWDRLQHMCKHCYHEINLREAEKLREAREAEKKAKMEWERQFRPHSRLAKATGDENCGNCKSFSHCARGSGYCMHLKASTNRRKVCADYTPIYEQKYEKEAKAVAVMPNTPWG